MPHTPHISVKAERFTKPTSFYRSEKKKKRPGGFRLTETVQGCCLFLIISLRECGKWDDVFYNAPKCLSFFFFFFSIFFFCSLSVCFITSVFHPYANTLKLTKQPMSFLEARGRLGVTVERAFFILMWVGGGDRGEESILNSCSRVCVMRRELASWLSVRTLCTHAHTHTHTHTRTHTQRHAVGTPSWKHDQTQALCSHAAAVLLRKNVTCFEWWQAAASAMQAHILLPVCCTTAALLTALWEESLQRLPLYSSSSYLN